MKKLLRLRKEVSHGGIIPPGWKLAWYEPRRRIGVYCPAPLHWIFRAARECIRRVRLAVRAPTIECAEVFEMQRKHRHREHLAAEYARGYFRGWHECFHVCLETVEDEVTRGSNLWDIGDLLSGTPPKQPRKN
jgi:hypothetical protein